MVLKRRTLSVMASRSSLATNIWPSPFSAASRADVSVVNAALMLVVSSPLCRPWGRMVVGGMLYTFPSKVNRSDPSEARTAFTTS